MAVWALMMRSIEGVRPFAFIDDSYLIGDRNAIQQLQAAINITKMWDELTGQALNEHKCNIFATAADVCVSCRPVHEDGGDC